jgi:hypothetical protein
VGVGAGPAAAAGRRGNATNASPRQSFHVNVASGGVGGFPWNATSKTARFTSFPGGKRATDVRTSSNWALSSVSAAASVVPGGTRYTYSR